MFTVALCKVIVVEPGTDTYNLRVLPAGVLGLDLRGEPGEESDSGSTGATITSFGVWLGS